jgi:hypothetical protein
MKTKALIDTNPYLKDTEMREKLISRSVRTSCGVEGIKPSKSVLHFKIDRRDKKIYKTFKV